MHRSYQPCSQNDSTGNYNHSSQTYHNNYNHLTNCGCQWCNSIAPRFSATSDYYSSYHSSCCSCEKCKDLCSDRCNCSDSSSARQHFIHSDKKSTDRTDYPPSKVLSKYYSRRRQYPTHLRNYNTYYSNNYCYNNGNIIEEPNTVHPEVNDIPSHRVDFISQTRMVNHDNNNTTAGIVDDSFHSCQVCDSHPIETVYENKGHLSSRSTINRCSNQTIESKTSKGILKTSFVDRKYRKKINSGYFEFVSPTRIQSASTSHNTPRNPKTKNSPVGFDMLKRPIHYGYFEVKERNYENHTTHQEKTAALELDNVPTKMSKQIDTTQFKELMMLDKSLSANFGRVEVQTADKALFANIPQDHRRCLTQSDIDSIVRRINNYRVLQPKCSNKMVQSVSNKSFTNVKVISNRSITKRRSRNASKLKAAKSLSEGSIHIHKNSICAIKKSQDKIVSYKNYLDAALDKLETQITKKIKKALTNYSDVPKKQSVVTLYHNSLQSSLKEPLQNKNYYKTEVGTNPSPTMVTLEDMVDSEEVEIDSSDFEKRSSLSHTCMNNSDKCNNNSDVSSYNAEGQSFVERSQAIENPKTEDTCEFALIKERSLQEQDNGFLRRRSDRTTRSSHHIYSASENLRNRQSLIYQSGHSITLNSYSGRSREPSSSSIRSRGASCQLFQTKQSEKLKQKNNSNDEKPPLKILDYPQPQQQDKSISSPVEPPPPPPPAAIKQECICGRKPRDSRDKAIRFGYASLGTIEEETESVGDSMSGLRLLHDDKDGSFESINDHWKDGGPGFSKTRRDLYYPRKVSKSVSDQYGRLESGSNESLRRISDPSKVNLFKVGNSNQRNDRCYYEDFLYDDCVKQQCPKKRYYAQKMALYNQERCRRNLEKHPDKLYSYMLNVPPYRGSHRYGNVRLLNLISFVIFLVMFYGIFQYIDVGVRTGKFPWT